MTAKETLLVPTVDRIDEVSLATIRFVPGAQTLGCENREGFYLIEELRPEQLHQSHIPLKSSLSFFVDSPI
jgi:hypothetical protein